MYRILFICLSINGHLGCFYILAVMNIAAINMGMLISLWDIGFISFKYILSSGIAGSDGTW